jgi:hypothetical protein
MDTSPASQRDSIVIDMELALPDLKALQYYVQLRLHKGNRRARLLVFFLVFLVAFPIALGLVFFGNVPNPASLALGAALGAVTILLLLRLVSRPEQLFRNSIALGPVRMRFDAQGVRAERPGLSGFTSWSKVQAIEETGDRIFMPVDQMTAFVIPKRHLTSPSPAEFLERVGHWHAGRGEPAPPAGSTAAVGLDPTVTRLAEMEKAVPLPRFVHERTFWRDLASNLRVGARVVLFRGVQPSDFVPGFGQVVALLLIAIALGAIYDWSYADDGAAFDFYGLFSWSACIVLGLWVCALAARTLSPRADTRSLILAMLAVAPYGITFLWVLSFVPDTPGGIAFFPVFTPLILFLLALRTIRVAYGFAKLSSALVVMVAAIIVWAGIDTGYLYPRIWQVPSQDDSGRDTGWEAIESTLFDQHELIDEKLADLAPERPGVADVFFVGFAGDGSQGVFRREEHFAKRVFAERMGSGNRSLDLVNDEGDRIAYPLATASGLRYSLVNLAARMNKEEDVLVLFLTSHGTQESGIYMRNGNLPLNDLDPEALQRALDASGIKWRIVIVSACYSGVFVGPLESENTMVITAAAMDRTSFGCADDRNLTYFGEAFLRDALPDATSLQAAFQAARKAIRAREKEEDLTPSNPQIFVGDALREKLSSLGDLPYK